MTRHEWKDLGIWIGVGMALAAVACVPAVIYASMTCSARWADFGQTSWGPLQGCMVHYKGRWTPASAIRETP